MPPTLKALNSTCPKLLGTEPDCTISTEVAVLFTKFTVCAAPLCETQMVAPATLLVATVEAPPLWLTFQLVELAPEVRLVVFAVLPVWVRE